MDTCCQSHHFIVVSCSQFTCLCSCRQMAARPGHRLACRGARPPCRRRCGTAFQGPLQDRCPLDPLPMSMSACSVISSRKRAHGDHSTSEIADIPPELKMCRGSQGLQEGRLRKEPTRSVGFCIHGLGWCLRAAWQQNLILLGALDVWVCPWWPAIGKCAAGA